MCTNDSITLHWKKGQKLLATGTQHMCGRKEEMKGMVFFSEAAFERQRSWDIPWFFGSSTCCYATWVVVKRKVRNKNKNRVMTHVKREKNANNRHTLWFESLLPQVFSVGSGRESSFSSLCCGTRRTLVRLSSRVPPSLLFAGASPSSDRNPFHCLFFDTPLKCSAHASKRTSRFLSIFVFPRLSISEALFEIETMIYS